MAHHTTLNALVRIRSARCAGSHSSKVMAPCFSIAALESLCTRSLDKEYLGDRLGMGLSPEGQEPLHVVDAVSMEHTRTVTVAPPPSTGNCAPKA